MVYHRIVVRVLNGLGEHLHRIISAVALLICTRGSKDARCKPSGLIQMDDSMEWNIPPQVRKTTVKVRDAPRYGPILSSFLYEHTQQYEYIETRI